MITQTRLKVTMYLNLVYILVCIPVAAGTTSQNADSTSIRTRIWATTPAASYSDSFMIGNGRLGAAIPGSPQSETIPVNEDSFWSGPQLHRVNPDALIYMPQMQSLVAGGQLSEAGTLGGLAYAGTPVSTQHYDVLGDLELSMDHGGDDVTDYERWLDVIEGTSGVRYTVDGTTYTREYLASNPEDVIAIRVTADKAGTVGFNVHFRRGASLNRWQDYAAKAGNDTVIIGGGSESAHAIEFASGARVIASGSSSSVKTIGDTIVCRGANEGWIYYTSWTSVRKSNPRAAVLAQLATIPDSDGTYGDIRAAHMADYQNLADRVTLDLGVSSDEQRAMKTSDRIAALSTVFDPELVELYFQFGRYLLISTSRNGTLPPNLQGIWNSDFDPQWGSKYTININTEMNYWPALVTNLAELNQPLFDLIDKMRATGAETAKTMYNARGAVCHHNTDLWGDTAPQDNYASSTFWPSGLAWMATHIWEHYLHTGDKETLSRHFPALNDSAVFYLDFLTDYNGWKVTNPSSSPEHAYYMPNSTTTTASITLGPTIDNSLIWMLFGIVLDAQQALGINNDELTAELIKSRSQLPPLRINSNGGIMEWIEDYAETEPGHRHFSHLFGLYPGNQITASNATTFAGAGASLYRRLENGGGDTGWSRAWAVSLAARLFNATSARNSVVTLLTDYTHSASLLDTGPPAPFQIDGNFGGTAGIAEMLVQSHEYVSTGGNGSISAAFVGDSEKTPLIRILPAFPSSWAGNGGGRVSGLVARGGFQVNIEWDGDGKLVNATMISMLGNEVWVTLGKSSIGDKKVKSVTVSGIGSGAFVHIKSEKGSKYIVHPS